MVSASLVSAKFPRTSMTFLNVVLALSCGGKSVTPSNEENEDGAGGEIGTSCGNDYACLRASANASAVMRCSNSGTCEISSSEPEPEPEPATACYDEEPLLELELNDSRVIQSARCASGICLLSARSIDPSNTTCTSSCATDADCNAPFAYTTVCRATQIYEGRDTGIVVKVCMPPMPW
jgi:hypothetical protein